MKKQYYVYVLTNYNKISLYVGVTSNIQKKIDLINNFNPDWKDLYDNIIL